MVAARCHNGTARQPKGLEDAFQSSLGQPEGRVAPKFHPWDLGPRLPSKAPRKILRPISRMTDLSASYWALICFTDLWWTTVYEIATMLSSLSASVTQTGMSNCSYTSSCSRSLFSFFLSFFPYFFRFLFFCLLFFSFFLFFMVCLCECVPACVCVRARALVCETCSISKKVFSDCLSFELGSTC